MTLVNSLCQTINSRGQGDIIFLDFSNAFDKVSHCELLQRLKVYGICGQTLSWVKRFLSNGSQTVVMDEEKSFPSDVLSGVPQETVLGQCFIYS